MNKNSLIGSILIAAIVIWWMTMSSNNAKQQAEAQAKEKEAAAAMEAARADSADQLVLGDKTPELKAAPVLGDDNLDERRETRVNQERSLSLIARRWLPLPLIVSQPTALRLPKPRRSWNPAR